MSAIGKGIPRPGRGRAQRRIGVALIVLCAAVLPAWSVDLEPVKLPAPALRPALAGGPVDTGLVRSAGTADLRAALRAPDVRRTFFDGYLVPRISRQLESVAPEHFAPQSAREIESYVLHDDVTDAARRCVERGAKRALKSYLLETTALGRIGRSIKRGSRSSAAERPEELRVGVGISHGEPHLEIRYDVRFGSMRVHLGVTGSAKLEFAHVRMSETRLVAGYDPDDGNFSVACRVRF
jgi:hypothetical protein